MRQKIMVPEWLWRLGGAFYLLVMICIILLADLGRFPFFLLGVGWDVVGHFVLIGTAAFLLNGIMAGRIVFRVGTLAVYRADLVVLGIALLEETSQILLLTRSFSLYDALADCLGVLLFGRLAVVLLPSTDH